MRYNIPRILKSGVPTHLTRKLDDRNQISADNLLNLVNMSLIAIRSQYDGPNVVKLYEGGISISDADSTEFFLDIGQGSTIENPSISEF